MESVGPSDATSYHCVFPVPFVGSTVNSGGRPAPSLFPQCNMNIRKIEKDVPIPEVHSKIKYPWPEMEVGDSVFIKAEKGETPTKLKRRAGASARYYGNRTGKKFKTRILRKENGIRVWQVE